MYSATLLAQPRSKHPLVKSSSLKNGRLDIKKRGTFGLIWFTDFGEKFWEACQSIDERAKLRLQSSGFDEMDWIVSFRFAGFKARLTSKKYKGFFGTPKNSLIELKIGCPNPNDLKIFIQAFSTKFEKPPWILNNWKKAEAFSEMNQRQILDSWSDAMGKEINVETDGNKGWGLFGTKSKAIEEETDEDEYEILEDENGNEVKMKLYGALELEGEEYAIMSYSDDSTQEFEIMKIIREKKGKVSYSAVANEKLYEDLSEAAAMHLEANGVI